MIERSDFYPVTEMSDLALGVLCSWPGMLDKIDACVRREPDPDPSYPSCSIEWARVADLAFNSGYSSGERAFLGICADLAGESTPPGTGESFGTRFVALDATRQRLVARAVAQLADATFAREQAARQVFGS